MPFSKKNTLWQKAYGVANIFLTYPLNIVKHQSLQPPNCCAFADPI